MAGAATTDAAVQGGVACELVHLGSLYHDDVMDEASTRRGVDTVNAKWGNLQAILAGDFLLVRASGIAASLGTEIAGLLASTIGWLCEGQIEELRHTYDTSTVEASYFTSIRGKTASLFGTAARIGGIVAGSDRGLINTLTDYGNVVRHRVPDRRRHPRRHGDEEQLGKPAGHDIVEGVYTLPVLRTLALGRSVSEELRDLLGRPLDMVERDKALAIVRSNDGVESAVATARQYVDAAEAVCDRLPAGTGADALRAAPAALLGTVYRRSAD